MVALTKDEVFILGGLGITGVLMSELERAEPLIVLLQAHRPKNAAGFVAEALYFAAKGESQAAIEVLEESGALEMETNFEQAISLYVHLLSTSDRRDEAFQIAKAIIEDGSMTQASSLEVIEEVIKNYNSTLSHS